MMYRSAKQNRLLARRARAGYGFILPFLIGFFVIFLPCIAWSFYAALNNIELKGMVYHFVGAGNFADLFLSDIGYRMLLLDALKKMLVDVVVINVFSFFIANVLNQKFLGRGLARTVFFLPVILATGIIAQVSQNDLMSQLYMTNTGSEVASGFSMPALDTLFNLEEMLLATNISPGIVGVVVGAVNGIADVVNSSGVQNLIFIAGLQSIPVSIFEAAHVEGATKWEEFWKITFPMMMPMIVVNIVYTIIDTFTRPSYGVLDAIQNRAFQAVQLGPAAAMSWVYCLMITAVLGLLYIITRLFAKRLQ